MAAQEYTTISVTPDVRDRVRALKTGQESYSDVLQRLLQQADTRE